VKAANERITTVMKSETINEEAEKLKKILSEEK